jgi:pimeloyl-ACP methyl ester carboxylesterase
MVARCECTLSGCVTVCAGGRLSSSRVEQGTGLNAWSPVLQDVSEFATVVAYDCAGIGGSEADGHAPTPTHVARKLRALLTGIGMSPPYVLVGHSWGGLLIRMFAAMYPGEVAGLVYVDPTDPRSLEQNLAYLQASGYSADGAREFLEKPSRTDVAIRPITIGRV